MDVLSSTEGAARGLLSRLANILSLVVSSFRVGKITFSEFLEELDELGLKGKRFGPDCYRRTLERNLDLRIQVEVVDDRGDAQAHRAFVEQGHTAVLWYRPERGLAKILVLGSLSPLEMTAAVYHELSHLAAGHPMRTGRLFEKSPPLIWVPSRRIAKRPPPLRQCSCETEARIREEYCLLAGALGAVCFDDDDLRQIK